MLSGHHASARVCVTCFCVELLALARAGVDRRAANCMLGTFAPSHMPQFRLSLLSTWLTRLGWWDVARTGLWLEVGIGE